MKKIFLLLLSLSAILLKSQNNPALAETFINKMIRGSFDSCRVYFDSSVIDKINPEMIRGAWEKIPNYVGEFKSYNNIRSEKLDTLEAVFITCAFEKTKLDLKVVFNKASKIVGIFFQPVKSNAVYNVPEYYQVSKLYETKIPLKTGIYEMTGVLCVPNNIENPPVVILVAGSGPNDKDETIGPNKILKDLALGLASNGIASYRYDKRTLAQASKMSAEMDKIGLAEEVFEDVFSAIKLLRSNEITKSSKIFIVGHSLGAMCAPYIAKKSSEVSGIVMMAGPERSLEDVVFDQIKYLAALDSVIDESDKKSIAEMELQMKTLKDSKKLKSAKAADLPLGMPSFYWQSIKNYDHVKTAKSIKQPILILQGERDYQVPMIEFNLWKKELGHDKKNSFISYPKSNHLFIKGEGKSKPDEYNVSSNVQEKVITDIATWIKGIK